MFDLSGRTALLTAAGQGIGRATALAFLKAGARVIATDINAEALRTLAEENQCETHVLDVLDDKQITALAANVGKIDILFNCAGYVHTGSILNCSDDDWDFAFRLNCRASFKMTQAFLPGMLAQRWGSIINIASIASSTRGIPNRFVYGASKAAVIGMTKAIAADYIAEGVRCNAICPGTVESPSLRQRIAAQSNASGKSLAEVEKMFIDRQPMGRLGYASEIAAAALFLASEEGSFTSGTTFNVDGGMTI